MTRKITSIILVIVLTVTMSITVFAAQSATNNGATMAIGEMGGNNATRSANSEVGEYCSFSTKGTFAQSGTLKVWVEYNGKIVSEVSTYVTHAGSTRTGFKRLKMNEDATTLSRSSLDLKTSFTPGQDYKIYIPQGKMRDGSSTNIVATLNGYQFSVNAAGGRHADGWVGHLIDAEDAFWMISGRPVKPSIDLFRADEYWPDPVDTTCVAGTYTVTMSSEKANYSYTKTIEVGTDQKIVGGSKMIEMGDFNMPAMTVDDLKLSVSFKAQ